MKIMILLLPVLCLFFSLDAQNIAGKWSGSFDGKTEMIFDIVEKDGNYQTTLKVPQQGVTELPVKTTTYINNELRLEIPELSFIYRGKMQENEIIEGEFIQYGQTISLHLSRTVEKAVKRPQTPLPPFPYHTEEVIFPNDKDGIQLTGTLTVPKQQNLNKAVVLVSGSGPQNRDEELFEHKPFAVLADHLTRQGITVLRYDDRGAGQSGGVYASASIYDFANDAEFAISYLRNRKDLKINQTGIIGHSEGGCIAFILAAKQIPDFIITMAGPGIKGDELIEIQQATILKAYGMGEQYIKDYYATFKKAFDLYQQNPNDSSLLQKFEVLAKNTPLQGQEKILMQQIASPELNSLIRFDPEEYYKNIKCPVFSLNGEKDTQVAGKINLDAIKKGISSNGNKNVTVKLYPDLNHLFQRSNTGLLAEYGEIEETINLQVLEDIATWIKK